MRSIPRLLSAGILAALLGCVIVPKTFQADIRIEIRHIQEQADNVLDYVEGKTEDLGVSGDAGDKTSRNEGNIVRGLKLASNNIAMAAELNEDSPRIKQIADSMKGRYSEVETLKGQGIVGENNRGLVELVGESRIQDAEQKNEVQRVVAAENKDRKELYKEIARINKDQDMNVGTVARVYAQKRLERAKPGQSYQLPPAGDDLDAFKNSAAGKKLGSAGVPDAWVRIK